MTKTLPAGAPNKPKIPATKGETVKSSRVWILEFEELEFIWEL